MLCTNQAVSCCSKSTVNLGQAYPLCSFSLARPGGTVFGTRRPPRAIKGAVAAPPSWCESLVRYIEVRSSLVPHMLLYPGPARSAYMRSRCTGRIVCILKRSQCDRPSLKIFKLPLLAWGVFPTFWGVIGTSNLPISQPSGIGRGGFCIPMAPPRFMVET